MHVKNDKSEDLETFLQTFLKTGSGVGGSTYKDNFAKALMSDDNSFKDSECPICYDTIQNPRLTRCMHLFCFECLTKWLDEHAQDPVCPKCRQPVKRSELYSTNPKENTQRFDYKKNWKSSSKITALMNEITEMIKKDNTNKCVVFSQWTAMLDYVQIPLNEAGIRFVRLDGSMIEKQRSISINEFKNNNLVKVFLISLKAGGLGLTLTSASYVFLLDPWWNPACEDQAIDRVHRIGQSKQVFVKRYIMKGSAEEQIIRLQEQKKKLAQGALSNAAKEDMKKLRLDELKKFFL